MKLKNGLDSFTSISLFRYFYKRLEAGENVSRETLEMYLNQILKITCQLN